MATTASGMKSIIHKANGFLIALTLITLLGAGLRLAKLGDYPGGFGQDEAVNLYDAWSLLTTGAEHHGIRWPLNSAQFGDYPSALQAYLTIPFVALLGPTELAARLPCALLNTAAIPLFGLLLFSLFRSRAAALFGAALLATSPWNIFFSRWAVSPGFVTFFQVAGLLLMIRLFTTRLTGPRLYGLSILTGFTLFMWTHQYLSQYFFAPLMIGAGLLLWSRGKWSRVMVTGATYSIFMLLAIIPRISNPSTAGRFSRESIFFTGQPWYYFWRNYWDYLSFDFLFNAPKMLPLHQIPGVAHIQHLLPVFYLAGMAVLLACAATPARLLATLGRPDSPDDRSHCRRVSLWMLAGLALAPLTGAVFTSELYTARMTHLLLHGVLITALGCAACWHLLKRLPMRLAAPVFAIVLAGYLGQSTIKTMQGLSRGNLYLKGWLQQGVPDVMRYLGKQENVRSVSIPTLFQGYIYHLAFTPVHPSRLNPAEIALRDPGLDHRWNYVDVTRIGNYHFYSDPDPAAIRETCTLRHKIRDQHGIAWYEIYEQDGNWTVLKAPEVQ